MNQITIRGRSDQEHGPLYGSRFALRPSAEDLELLPIPEHRWVLMTHANDAFFEKLEYLGERYRDLTERAKEEGGKAWLEAQRKELHAELEKMSARIQRLAAGAGVDAFAWNRWNEIRSRYKGPRRASRFAASCRESARSRSTRSRSTWWPAKVWIELQSGGSSSAHCTE